MEDPPSSQRERGGDHDVALMLRPGTRPGSSSGKKSICDEVGKGAASEPDGPVSRLADQDTSYETRVSLF